MSIVACPECGNTHVSEGLSTDYECLDCEAEFDEEDADYVDEEDYDDDEVSYPEDD